MSDISKFIPLLNGTAFMGMARIDCDTPEWGGEGPFVRLVDVESLSAEVARLGAALELIWDNSEEVEAPDGRAYLMPADVLDEAHEALGSADAGTGEPHG